MGKPEAHIEGYFVKKATDLGAMVRKLEWVAHNGAPDRFVALLGLTVFIEFKSPEGRVSKAQIRELELLTHHGVKAMVISSREEADALLNHMKYIVTKNSMYEKIND